MKKYNLDPLFDVVHLEPVQVQQTSLILPETKSKEKSGLHNFRVIATGPLVKFLKVGDFIINGMPIGRGLFDGEVVFMIREQDVIFKVTEAVAS